MQNVCERVNHPAWWNFQTMRDAPIVVTPTDAGGSRRRQPLEGGHQAVQLVAGVVHGDAGAQQPATLGETQYLHRTGRVEVSVPDANSLISQCRRGRRRRDLAESDRYG